MPSNDVTHLNPDLNPNPASASAPKTGLLTDFINFLQKFGIVGLAIAVVIGQATNQIVGSLVENLLTPIINLIIPTRGDRTSFANLEFYGIRYGAFFNDLIHFALVVLIVYLIVKYLLVMVLTEDERKKLNL